MQHDGLSCYYEALQTEVLSALRADFLFIVTFVAMTQLEFS
jgi:hypothetical protein